MDFRTVTMVHLVQFGHEFLCVCFCKLRAVTKLAVSKVTAATWQVALRLYGPWHVALRSIGAWS